MSSDDNEKKQFPDASKHGSNEENAANKQPETPVYVYETSYKNNHEQTDQAHSDIKQKNVASQELIDNQKQAVDNTLNEEKNKTSVEKDTISIEKDKKTGHDTHHQKHDAHYAVADYVALSQDATHIPASSRNEDNEGVRNENNENVRTAPHNNQLIDNASKDNNVPIAANIHAGKHKEAKHHLNEQASQEINENNKLFEAQKDNQHETQQKNENELKPVADNILKNTTNQNKEEAQNTVNRGDKKTKNSKSVKRRRSGIIRNPLIILANFFLTILVLATVVYVIHFYTDRAAFEEPGPSQVAKTILIRPGAGVGEIATILERENVITRSQAFKNGVSYYDQTNKLKAGEYEIPVHASMHQVMDILASGKSIEYSLTIPEGLTVQQAINRIGDNDILTGDLPTKLPVEGALLADTVRFTRGTTRKELIRRLEEGQKKLVQTIWEKRDPDIPVKNINEFITLASIVEKETGIPSERPMVAGVFINRLNQGMRLDSDPTFLYGIYGGEGKPADKPVTRDDRLSDTPYNTYRMKGLPPTPIAIPGKDALEAVAHPAKTDALFFVADGTGGHIFAKTLEEHNNNVAKWRQFRASQ